MRSAPVLALGVVLLTSSPLSACESWILTVVPPEAELHSDLEGTMQGSPDEPESLRVFSSGTERPAPVLKEAGFAASYDRLSADSFGPSGIRVLLSKDKIGAVGPSGSFLKEEKLPSSAPERKYHAITESSARRAPDGRVWLSWDDWAANEPFVHADRAPGLIAVTEGWVQGNEGITKLAWPWASVGRWVMFARGGKPGDSTLFVGYGEQSEANLRNHLPRVGLLKFSGRSYVPELLPALTSVPANLNDLQETTSGVAALWTDHQTHVSLWQGSSWQTLPSLELGEEAKPSFAVTASGEIFVVVVKTLRMNGRKYSRQDEYTLELYTWDSHASAWRLSHPDQEAGLRLAADRYKDNPKLWMDSERLRLAFMSETDREGYSETDIFFVEAHGRTDPKKLAKYMTRARDVFVLERGAGTWRAITPAGLVQERAIPTGYYVQACH